MKKFRLFNSIYGAMLATAVLAFVLISFTGDSSSGPAAIGTRTIVTQAVADTVTSSTTTVATDLTTPIAANQKVHIRYYVPITLGGTAPGIKFLVNAPASPTTYLSSVVIFTDSDSVGYTNTIVSEAAQGVTLANAGTHWAVIDVSIENGSTAGSVSLEFTQNVSDAAATIVQKGAIAEITKF